MNWWQFALPTVAVAALVRMTAVWLGPYWSWLELVSYLYLPDDRKRRRASVIVRVLIPGMVAFVCALVWPETYGHWDGTIIAIGGAILMIWPVLIQGRNKAYRLWTTVAMYLLLILVFAVTGWLGVEAAALVSAEGGLIEYAKKEAITWIIAVFLISGGSLGFSKISEALSRPKDLPDIDDWSTE